VLIAFFVIGGLLITLAVGIGTLSSGWTELKSRFPDRAAQPLRTFLFRSATIGDGWKLGRSFGGVIMFQVCQDGLRVGLIAPFSMFSEPFFVPWDEVVFEAFPLLVPRKNIVFGKPMAGVATVSAGLERQIVRARQDLITPAP